MKMEYCEFAYQILMDWGLKRSAVDTQTGVIQTQVQISAGARVGTGAGTETRDGEMACEVRLAFGVDASWWMRANSVGGASRDAGVGGQGNEIRGCQLMRRGSASTYGGTYPGTPGARERYC